MDFTQIGKGGFFNTDQFVGSMSSMDTWASTVSSIAGAGVSSTMGQFNLGNVGGFNTGQIGEIGGLNSFVGSLAGSAVTYGMTGNVTFNVARAKGVGLFEMSFGKDGFSSRFGMGGTDISMGTIGSAMKGAQHWGVNNQIEDAALANDMDVATALRTQYGFGDEAALAQLDGILDGTTKLAHNADSLADAQTVSDGNGRTVYLNNYKEGMTDEEQFKMGIELGHEAHRDGLTGTEQEQDIETIKAVQGHTVMAMRMQSDPAYKKMMDNLIVNDGNLVDDMLALQNGDMIGHVLANYDTSADYWKLMEREDGTYGIVPDGLHSLVDEEGNVLIRSEMDEFDANDKPTKSKGGGSLSASLGEYLGMHPDYNAKDDKNEYAAGNVEHLLALAGITWSKTEGNYIAEEGASIDANPFLMTKVGLEGGDATVVKGADGSFTATIPIRNERNEIVSTKTVTGNDGDTNFLLIENMIPDGNRLKAGTFKVTETETGIEMYGMGSTMPDPDRMGTSDVDGGYIITAPVDGIRPYAWSWHGIGDDSSGYPAMRIYANAGAVPSFESVTGSSKGIWDDNFPQGDGKWDIFNTLRGFSYDGEGNQIFSNATFINGHRSNNSFWEDSSGGSDGCIIWAPGVFKPMVQSFSGNYGFRGTIELDRGSFGDGTGGNNNWQDWAMTSDARTAEIAVAARARAEERARAEARAREEARARARARAREEAYQERMSRRNPWD